MSLNGYARVAYADFSGYERVIVISDIHGDTKGFRGVLKKVRFSERDALVIVGDILEKGSGSLPLLRLIMEMYKKGNVFMVLGNNDVILSEWRDMPYSDEAILRYLPHTKHTVFQELAEEQGIKLEKAGDVARLKKAVFENYKEEIAFLDSLPLIIESRGATFVHAGIKPGDIEKQDPLYCLTAEEFGRSRYHFDKKVIVGHWPGSNYGDKVIDANIYYNEKNNVYSIDGGCGIKSWQQVNYMILDADGEIRETGHYDGQRQIKVLDAREETPDPVTLIFAMTHLEIIKAGEETSLCYIPYIDKEMEIENKNIYEYKGKLYCEDYTTYHMGVKSGETVYFCEEIEGGIFIKRDGVVGIYDGRYEFIN
ncbi:MAG: metallophosphoesterase [Lachnospiraceae bacterium]|nr:metallophosphoesterase [Lachnospiraceae bacterium]